MEDLYDASGQLSKTIELIPNGAKTRVTNATKNQYLDALAQQRLCNSVKDEVDSFLKGLNAIIPDNLLSIFDENELEVTSPFTKLGSYSNPSLFLFVAAHVRHGGVLHQRFQVASHCQRQLVRVSSRARLVLGRSQQFQPDRNGSPLAIHHGMFSITAGWFPGAQSAISNHGSAHVWQSAHSAHLVRRTTSS